jgi:ArsR family metal-binding transcriptional regulator
MKQTVNIYDFQMIFDYLKKTYPKSNYADEDLTKNANYNDVFFEMVDDVRNKFLNEKQYDSANEIVEEYMDKNNF